MVWSGLDGSVLHTFFGSRDGETLGFSVAAAGEVDFRFGPDLPFRCMALLSAVSEKFTFHALSNSLCAGSAT